MQHIAKKIPFGATLSLIISNTGTAIFIAKNTGLPMLELSNNYSSSADEQTKMQLAVAGEALLVRGAHGSLGVFPGFVLIIISEDLILCIMLKGLIFSKTTAWLGLSGNSLLFIYIILVTFVPGMKSVAMLKAAPGGLLTLAWMIMFTGKFYKLGR